MDRATVLSGIIDMLGTQTWSFKHVVSDSTNLSHISLYFQKKGKAYLISVFRQHYRISILVSSFWRQNSSWQYMGGPCEQGGECDEGGNAVMGEGMPVMWEVHLPTMISTVFTGIFKNSQAL